MNATTVHKRVTPSDHGFRLALVVLVALVAAGVGLALGRDRGSPAEAATAASAEASDPKAPSYDPSFDVPEGKVPVAFNDDGEVGLAGFIDAASEDMDTPEPVLDLGSGRFPATGWPVTDADGVLVGFMIGHFVDLETARDDEAIDALLAERAARDEALARHNADPLGPLPPGIPDPREG